MTNRATSRVRFVEAVARIYGLDVRRASSLVARAPYFYRSMREYRSAQVGSGAFPLRIRNLRPILHDLGEQAGELDAEYFYQDWWVAKQVFLAAPRRHVDIGSRVDGFLSHLLVFRSVEMIDIRPLEWDIPELRTVQADARRLDPIETASVDSVSCLHAMEHFGLGRYGDPIDVSGYEKVASEIVRILEPAGKAYVSVPVGRERLEFNAQRVFSPERVLGLFGELRLEAFAAVDDDGRFRADAEPDEYALARDACGVFVFSKPVGRDQEGEPA